MNNMEFINKDVFFVDDVYSENIKQGATREGYGLGLLEAGKRDENVIAICADLTGSTNTLTFAKQFPRRFIQVGIGEQSMASIASGAAAMGKIPFFASYAIFSPGRNWEQIRTTICYNGSNAKIIGAHAGVSVGPDGGTHQALEDIALTRILPRMTVLVPFDAVEAEKAVLAAAKHIGPVYIRLARCKTPIISTKDTPFEIGKSLMCFEAPNAKITIFSCGNLLHTVLQVANELQKNGINTRIVNISTIKPLDKKILEYAKQSKAFVTVEEHQVAGGMGSAICEFVSESHNIPIKRIGIDDVFGESGKPEELLDHHGLSTKKIIKTIEQFSNNL